MIRVYAMASALEIAGYRKTHSVAETCARFGIKERAVYKACAKAREEQMALAVAVAGTSQVRSVRIVRRPHTRQPGQPHHAVLQKPLTPKDPLDEIAGDDTDWQCPYTGEVYPIIPGTTKRMWLADRRTEFVLQSQKKRPVPTDKTLCRDVENTSLPALQKEEQGSESTPALAENVAPALPAPVHLQQQTPHVVYVKQYVHVHRDFRSGLVYHAGSLIARHGPPWTVWVAIAIFLLIVWLCQV